MKLVRLRHSRMQRSIRAMPLNDTKGTAVSVAASAMRPVTSRPPPTMIGDHRDDRAGRLRKIDIGMGDRGGDRHGLFANIDGTQRFSSVSRVIRIDASPDRLMPIWRTAMQNRHGIGSGLAGSNDLTELRRRDLFNPGRPAQNGNYGVQARRLGADNIWHSIDTGVRTLPDRIPKPSPRVYLQGAADRCHPIPSPVAVAS